MKRFYAILRSVNVLLLLLVLGACNNESDPVKKIILNLNSENDLLPKKVFVNYEVELNAQVFPEWTKGVDTALMFHLTENVLNSDVSVYFPMIQYTPVSTEIITRKEIETVLNQPNPVGVSALYFIENWFFNQSSYQFRKEIETWSPVFLYQRIVKKDTTVNKSLLFDLKCLGGNASTLLAKDMTYEVTLDPENPNFSNFTPLSFAQLVLNPVLSGEKSIVDFYDNKAITIDNLKLSLGKTSDTLMIEDPNTGESKIEINQQAEQLDKVLGYIFVEDWFLNKETFVITKKVKSIAPVYYRTRTFENGETETSKRVIGRINL